MFRLLLLRHGKATRKEGRFEDFDRPLTVGGWEEARRIGRFLAGELPPGLIVASSSRRTRETLAAVLSYLDREATCHLDRGLYESGVEDLLDFTASADADPATVLLIGHNPGFEEALRFLSWPDDPSAASAISAGLPTGGLAVFEFDATSWPEVRPGQGRLVLVKSPRELPPSEPPPKE
jgi:phosphohistidine phosphatase